MEIIKVNVEDDSTFYLLYHTSAMTWEGLAEESFEQAFEYCGVETSKGYLIKGKVMNEYYGLTGSNAYPDDLNIFALTPFTGIAMRYSARWFDDIVDNNDWRQSCNAKA